MRSMVKLMLGVAVAVASATAQARDVRAELETGNHDAFDAAPPASEGVRDSLTVYDYAGRSQSPSYSFGIGRPLGSERSRLSDVIDSNYRDFDREVTPTYRCGPERSRGFMTCGDGVSHAGAPAAAPEIDARFATEGALLLMGSLLVLRGRRTSKAEGLG
jgi:hypothetical protein